MPHKRTVSGRTFHRSLQYEKMSFSLGFEFRILGINNDKNKLNSIYILVTCLGHYVNIDIKTTYFFLLLSVHVTFNLWDLSL